MKFNKPTGILYIYLTVIYFPCRYKIKSLLQYRDSSIDISIRSIIYSANSITPLPERDRFIIYALT